MRSRGNSKWIIIAFLAFIGYAFVSSNNKKPLGGEVDALKGFLPTKEEIKSQVSVWATSDAGKKFIEQNFVSDGALRPVPVEPVKEKSLIKQQSVGDVSTLDSVKGEGRSVGCGQAIKVNYSLVLANGKTIDSTYDRKRPISFTVGKKQVIRGVELGVIGMQKGGIRKLEIPAELAYDDPKFSSSIVPSSSVVKAEVELLDILSPASTAIAEQPVDKIIGTGREALCGDVVVAAYTIKNQKGMTIAALDETKPKAFVLADGTVPVGLIAAIENMRQGGRRVLTVPASTLRMLPDGKVTDSVLPKKSEEGNVSVEISLIRVN